MNNIFKCYSCKHCIEKPTITAGFNSVIFCKKYEEIIEYIDITLDEHPTYFGKYMKENKCIEYIPKFGATPRLNDMLNDLTQWAVKVGLNTSTPEKQLIKVMEEVGELAHSIIRNEPLKIADAIGDIIITLNTLCLVLGLNLTDCVKHCYNEVINRKGEMVDGVFIKEEDLNKKIKGG